jgi:hypothetical protein
LKALDATCPLLSLLLGFLVLTGCSSDDTSPIEQSAARCALITDPRFLSAVSEVWAYPDDKFGISVQTTAEDIHVFGTLEDYAGVSFELRPCVNLSAFDGLEFELAGAEGFGDPRPLLFAQTADNYPKPQGTVERNEPWSPSVVTLKFPRLRGQHDYATCC